MRQQLTDDLEAKYKEIRGDSRLLHSTVIKKKKQFQYFICGHFTAVNQMVGSNDLQPNCKYLW